MIVRYARARAYQGKGKDPHLTLGNEYIVLGILFRSEDRSHEITIRSDSEGVPSLWDIGLFDVIDPDLPNGWVLLDLGSGYYRLAPKEFAGDFWGRFHDGDPDAEKLFEQVVGKLKAFHVIRRC